MHKLRQAGFGVAAPYVDGANDSADSEGGADTVPWEFADGSDPVNLSTSPVASERPEPPHPESVGDEAVEAGPRASPALQELREEIQGLRESLEAELEELVGGTEMVEASFADEAAARVQSSPLPPAVQPVTAPVDAASPLWMRRLQLRLQTMPSAYGHVSAVTIAERQAVDLACAARLLALAGEMSNAKVECEVANLSGLRMAERIRKFCALAAEEAQLRMDYWPARALPVLPRLRDNLPAISRLLSSSVTTPHLTSAHRGASRGVGPARTDGRKRSRRKSKSARR